MSYENQLKAEVINPKKLIVGEVENTCEFKKYSKTWLIQNTVI
jgi:hypothetical protein